MTWPCLVTLGLRRARGRDPNTKYFEHCVRQGAWSTMTLRHATHLGGAVLSHEEEVYQSLQNELVVSILENFLQGYPNEYTKTHDAVMTTLERRQR